METGAVVPIATILRDFSLGLRDLYGSAAPTVLLYGSHARGEARPDSDIDLVLLYPRPVHAPEEIRRISGVLSDLNLRYQVLISVIPSTISIYRQANDPFWQNVRREGVPIERI